MSFLYPVSMPLKQANALIEDNHRHRATADRARGTQALCRLIAQAHDLREWKSKGNETRPN
jgi:hypothetical protein